MANALDRESCELIVKTQRESSFEQDPARTIKTQREATDPEHEEE